MPTCFKIELYSEYRIYLALGSFFLVISEPLPRTLLLKNQTIRVLNVEFQIKFTYQNFKIGLWSKHNNLRFLWKYTFSGPRNSNKFFFTKRLQCRPYDCMQTENYSISTKFVTNIPTGPNTRTRWVLKQFEKSPFSEKNYKQIDLYLFSKTTLPWLA